MAHLIAEFGLAAPPAGQIAEFAALDAESSPLNTTIAVVATDAALTPMGCHRLAVAAQDGLAHAIRPAHTPLDGDTVFALATGRVDVPPDPDTPVAMSPETKLVAALGAAAADCLARAVLVGVLAAESVAGIPTYREMLPGAFGVSNT
jgi:L-aminopeptidase/D-esterase-like protein